MPYKDPQKQQEANARWLAKNRARVREYQRLWKQARRRDPEFQIKERAAKNKYQQNPDNRKAINAANQAWKEKNQEKFDAIITRGKDTRARYRVRLRSRVIQEYGGRCICCNISEEIFLSIDHIDQKGAEHRRKEFGSSNPGSYVFYLWLKKQGFPKDNFRCLCRNCQYAYFMLGACPHQALTPSSSMVL